MRPALHNTNFYQSENNTLGGKTRSVAGSATSRHGETSNQSGSATSQHGVTSNQSLDRMQGATAKVSGSTEESVDHPPNRVPPIPPLIPISISEWEVCHYKTVRTKISRQEAAGGSSNTGTDSENVNVINVYVCKVCSVEFSTDEDLTSHCIGRHSAVKCKICWNLYSSAVYLKHLSEHTETLIFECKTCSRRLFCPYEIKFHLTGSHGVLRPRVNHHYLQVHICRKCKETFECFDSYSVHKKTCKATVIIFPN